MTGRLIVLVAVLSALAWGTPFLSSDFNNGTTQGWTLLNWDPGFSIVQPGGILAVLASGGIGNSPYLQDEDQSNGFLYFKAPSSWAGNFLGSQLSFTLRSPNPNNYVTSANFAQPEVMIQSSSGPTLYYWGVGTGVNWTDNQIVLTTGTKWSLSTTNSALLATDPEVEDALSSITGVYILGDWVSGYSGKPGDTAGRDINGLDNVFLGTPEPGTIALTGIGLAFALLGLRKRARTLLR